MPDTPKIIFYDGQFLFRENKVAASADCCRGCCCKDGFIDRSFKYKNTCEAAGGTWGPCPFGNVCACDCTGVVNVNGFDVGPGTPNDFSTYTRIGTESVTTHINGGPAQWKFAAATTAGCLPNNETVVLSVLYISVQLWVGDPLANVTGVDMNGWTGFAFEYLFDGACFDDEPNSWPCAKSIPYYTGGPIGIGDDIAEDAQNYFSLLPAGFTPASEDWAEEFRDVAAKYLSPHSLTLDCTFHPACEEGE